MTGCLRQAIGLGSIALDDFSQVAAPYGVHEPPPTWE
jgi:hypothetical protein